MATRTARKELADVKQPEDHKIEIKDVSVESHGHTFTIKGKALRDYRLIIMLTKVEKDGGVLPEVMTKLLGEEQHELMMTVLADEDGHIDLEDVGDFLRSLLSEARLKNS